MCDKGDVDFLKFLYPDGNDGFTDQFGEAPYAMNADAGVDYIICAPYISGSGKCPGEGSAKCERKTVRVASYQNTPDGGSSCDEVVFYLEPKTCTKCGSGTGGGEPTGSKEGSGSKSWGKKGDDSSDDSDSKGGSDSKSGYGYKSGGGSKEQDSSKSGDKGGLFKGWEGKDGKDGKDGDSKLGLGLGLKINLFGKDDDHKSYAGDAKDKDDGSKTTKSGEKPCAKGKFGGWF